MAEESQGFRIRLRVGIAVMFLSVMLPLTALMTGILYRQNSQLAVQLAETAMDGASRDVVAGVGSLLGPMAGVVDHSVAFGKAERGAARRIDGLRPLVDELDRFPELYALYFAFARDGAFYEVIRVPPPEKGGLKDHTAPAKARYALRMIDSVDGEWTDSWIYIAKWGEVVGVERVPAVRYDPRPRPWYLAALATGEIATSSLHVFTSSGRPGLTLSRQLATDDGQVMAVFGADLTTETLSQFLAASRVGGHGVVFILDEEQRLIGYPDADRPLVMANGTVEIAKAAEFNDPVVADAVKRRAAGAGDRFRAPLGPDGESYLVAFSRFPEDFGKNWTIGVIAAERDFIGPLRRASAMILLIGTVFLTLASIAVVWVSRLLTKPIQRLTAETERIRTLDLGGDIRVNSSVVEIQTLSEALGAMKAALRSFVAYVPKDVVKGIIESGAGTGIGGERRMLTVLFSDIKGFTGISEGMAPEDLLPRLSTYLKGMSKAISSHNGTVDKFIGDAVMALWNAPQWDEDHVANACRAVLACGAAAHRINAELAAAGLPSLPTRFGLHTGMAVVGNVGCDDRMQYTALGAVVNLASRVEALNKHFGTEMLVTGAVEEIVRDRFVFRPLGLVVAQGTTAPVPLFELLGEAGAVDGATLARLAAWGDATAAYRAEEWSRATAAFQSFLADYPDDDAARLLLDRAIINAADPERAEPVLHFTEK